MSDDLRKPLDDLALVLLKECNSVKAKLGPDVKVDIFKAVAQYYLGCNRTDSKSKRGEPADGKTFDSIVSRLNGTQNAQGGTA